MAGWSTLGEGPMGARTRRTLVIESLETRMVLSRSPSLTLAALGDSYTAEYGANPTGHGGARNWVEILSATRRAAFGPNGHQSASSSLNPDFPYNWAVMGATTTDVLHKQLPGLLPEVASGSVSYVCIFVGINDFGGVVTDFVKNPTTSQADLARQVDQTLTTATNNLDQIIMMLHQANPQVKLVVATIPNVPDLPLMVQALDRPGGQALGQALSTAVQAYNDHIRLLSNLYPSIAVADVASSFQANLAPAGSGTVRAYAASTGASLNDTFQYDGLHPNTIPQGWIANDFLNALRSGFAVRTTMIPNRQVAQYARVAQTAPDARNPLAMSQESSPQPPSLTILQPDPVDLEADFPRTVLITGASGNLGRKLRDAWADRYDLILLDVDAAGDPEIIEADLSVWDESWIDLFDDADTVVHLAANPSDTTDWPDLVAPNLDALFNVFLAAATAGVDRLIFASSNHAMGGYRTREETPISVDLPARPGNAYGAAKLMGERLGVSLARVYGLSFVGLRIGWTQRGENRPETLPDDWSRGLWLSNADFVRLVTRAVEAELEPGEVAIVNGMSRNTGTRWSLSEAADRIGFEPIDDVRNG